ncbi:MAG: PAS domain S-box protein, partial [Devosia sp.]
MTGNDPTTSAFVDTLPGLVWRWDAEGGCTFVNARWTIYTGVLPADLRGAGWLGCVHADDRTAARAAWASAVRDVRDVRFTFRLRGHDGAFRWFETAAAVVAPEHGRPASWSLVSLDVDDGRTLTDVARAEHLRVEASARAWQRAFEQAAVGIARVDVATNTFIETNDAYAAIRGLSREALVGDALAHAYAPEWKATLRDQVAAADRTGHVVFEAAQLHRDGTSVPVHVDITVIYDDHGAPTSRLAFVTDISARKRAEATASLWRRAFQQADVAIALGDTEGRFSAVNAAFARQHGYAVDELIGQSQLMTIDDASVLPVRTMLARNLDHYVFESTLRRKDGTTFPTSADVTSIHDDTGAV